MTFTTFEAGGTTFVVVPLKIAAKHGIIGDELAERRHALGGKLRAARERAGLSQAALAQRLECAQPSVSAVEHGREPCSEERATRWLTACSPRRRARQ